jgi:hypothetical protein
MAKSFLQRKNQILRIEKGNYLVMVKKEEISWQWMVVGKKKVGHVINNRSKKMSIIEDHCK